MAPRGIPEDGCVREVVDGDWVVDLVRSTHEVTTDDGVKLVMIRKAPVDHQVRATAILLHGFGQNRHTWSLSRRSFEAYLVHHRFETFNVELRGCGLSRARGSPYPAGLAVHLACDMPALLDAVRALSPARRPFLIGHSVGGTIAYCVGARFQDYLAGIVSIAAPLHLGKGNRFIQWLCKVGNVADRLTLFRLWQPRAFYVDAIGALARRGLFLLDRPDNRLPIQVWYPRSIERDLLHERIEKGFDRTSINLLREMIRWAARGRPMTLDGGLSAEQCLDSLAIPLLVVGGDRDLTVPPPSFKGAHDRARSNDKTFKVFGGEQGDLHWGHCDLICGRWAPGVVWPYVLQWMTARMVPSAVQSPDEPS